MVEAYTLGKNVEVSKDGNYGYHSIILGLKDIGKEDEFRTITDLRYRIYKHSGMSFEELRYHVVYGAMPKRSKERAVTYWKSKTLSLIFKASENVKLIVDTPFWWHGVEIFAISCNLLQGNIIIYLLTNASTLVLMYLDGNLIHRQIFNQNVFDFMRDSKNKNQTIYMIYTSSNYEFHKLNEN